MKKINVIVLTLMLLLQSFGAVVAAEENNNWKISYSGSFTNITPRENYIADIMETSAFEGTRSLYFYCYEASRDENNYIEVKNFLIKTLDIGIYTLKFYTNPGIYGIYAGNIDVMLGDEVYTVNSAEGTAVNAPTGENGWIEHTLTFNYDGEKDDSLCFRVYSNVFGIYVDNVTLTPENSDENVVYDSSFEEYFFEEIDQPYDRTDYKPDKLMITSAKEALALSWINPKTSELKKISVYDVTDGKDELLTDMLSINSEEIVIYKVSGLSDGESYLYKIVFSYETKGEDVYFLGGVPSNIDYRLVEGIELRPTMSGGAGICPGEIVIDNNEGYESSNSIKFISNINPKYPGMESNIYLRFDIPLPDLKEGSKYAVNYWLKGKDVKSDFQVHMRWNAFDSDDYYVRKYGDFDWTQIKESYSSKGANALTFIIDGECDALWIDNIECYEIDAQTGEKIGENLIKNGDFELESFVDSGAITKLSATAGTGEAELSWNMPVKSYAGVNIYEKVFDEFEYRGRINDRVTGFDLSGLKKDKEYTYKIVPINSNGVEGEGKEVTFTTILPDFEVTQPVLKKNGIQTSEVSGGGNYSVSVKAKNNAIESGLNCELIVAVYNGNTLEGIYSSKETVDMKNKNIPATSISAAFTIPDGGDYSAEVYVVDSRQDINVYYNPINY